MKKILISMLMAFSLCMIICTGAFAGVVVVSSTSIYDSSDAMYGNLDRAIASLDGKVIIKGQTFSFNETVGPRTAENGYAVAPNGNGVATMGGGVSQIATTLHAALRTLEKEIIYDELHHFGDNYAANYVESKEETVLTDFSRNFDYRFTSNHAENLVISMWRSGDVIYCQLTGTTTQEQPTQPVSEATQTPVPEQSKQESPQLLYVINVDNYVNLREAPTTSADSLARIPKDAIVERISAKEGDFQHVRYDGKEGYVHDDYLSETNPNARMLKVVNCMVSVTLRESPSRQAKALADVPLGSEVTDCNHLEGDFRKVQYQGMEGYILNNYLE